MISATSVTEMEDCKPDSAQTDPKDEGMNRNLEDAQKQPPENNAGNGSPENNVGNGSPENNVGNGSPEAKVKTPKSVRWSEKLVSEATYTPSSVDPDTSPYSHSSAFEAGSNSYVSHSISPPPSVSFKDKMDTVRNVLGRWRSNVKDAAKKAEDLAGNTWQHLKTNPSFADAAMGRIVHSTKVLAEGGYEQIFHQTFETTPWEQLQDSFACYLSTSAGPVMGTLYVSTAKLAFCSDNPLPYKNGDETDWSYYKVAIPLNQLKAVNSSSSRVNPAEKYIQIISVDNHEFWYMGFLKYEKAVNILQGALQSTNSLEASFTDKPS